ncbi:MAG: hypothetical protein N4A47_00380 [Clostridia bacterium]|jgi:hypothetical protein|nr:hypothetical protein [Clostridia bacterium]
MKGNGHSYIKWYKDGHEMNLFFRANVYKTTDFLEEAIYGELTRELYRLNKSYFPMITTELPEVELREQENNKRKRNGKYRAKKYSKAKAEKDLLNKEMKEMLLKIEGFPNTKVEKLISEARDYGNYQMLENATVKLLNEIKDEMKDLDFKKVIENFGYTKAEEDIVFDIEDYEERQVNIEAVRGEFLLNGNINMLRDNIDRIDDVDKLIMQRVVKERPGINPKKLYSRLNPYLEFISVDEKTLLGYMLEEKEKVLENLEVVYVNGDKNKEVSVEDMADGENYTIVSFEQYEESEDNSRGSHEDLNDREEYRRKITQNSYKMLLKDIEIIPEMIKKMEEDEMKKDIPEVS